MVYIRCTAKSSSCACVHQSRRFGYTGVDMIRDTWCVSYCHSIVCTTNYYHYARTECASQEHHTHSSLFCTGPGVSSTKTSCPIPTYVSIRTHQMLQRKALEYSRLNTVTRTYTIRFVLVYSSIIFTGVVVFAYGTPGGVVTALTSEIVQGSATIEYLARNCDYYCTLSYRH